MKKLFDFASIRRSTQSVAERLQDLNNEIQDLHTERIALAARPAAKADVRSAVTAWVQRRGEAFRPHLADTVQDLAARPDELDRLAWLGIAGPTDASIPVTAGALDGLLCSLFRDQALAVLFAAIDAAHWDEGPPLAERRKRFAEIDERLAAAQKEFKELRAEAEQAGLSV